MTARPQRLEYSASLDGIRALAACLIVFYHAPIPGFSGGFFAVDIFFVLSGYLVTRMLCDEYSLTGKIAYRAFLWRRLRRLAPALFLMLLFYLAVAPWVFSSTPWIKHVRDAGWTAIYVINYVATFGELISVLGQVWSLAVEMQFYLLWPLILLPVLRLPRSVVVVALLALFVLATIWRVWSAASSDDVWAFYIRTDGHCSGLLLGGLVGYLNPRFHRYWAYLAVLILAFAMTFFSTRWLATAQYGFTIVELGSALLLISRPAWLGALWLAWLGQMSYGLYLWHYTVMSICREQGMDWPWVLAVGGGFGLLFAVLSHYLVERRFYRPRFSQGRN